MVMCGILQDFSLNLSSLWFFCFSCFNFSFSFPCTAIREPENLIAVCITSILYGMSLHSGYLAPVFASACKARRKRDCDSVLKHFDCMSTLDFYHINRFVDGVFSYFFYWMALYFLTCHSYSFHTFRVPYISFTMKNSWSICCLSFFFFQKEQKKSISTIHVVLVVCGLLGVLYGRAFLAKIDLKITHKTHLHKIIEKLLSIFIVLNLMAWLIYLLTLPLFSLAYFFIVNHYLLLCDSHVCMLLYILLRVHDFLQ